jgi:hypothetical protein
MAKNLHFSDTLSFGGVFRADTGRLPELALVVLGLFPFTARPRFNLGAFRGILFTAQYFFYSRSVIGDLVSQCFFEVLTHAGLQFVGHRQVDELQVELGFVVAQGLFPLLYGLALQMRCVNAGKH